MKTVFNLINTHLLAALTVAYILGIIVSANAILSNNTVLISTIGACFLLLLCCLKRAIVLGIFSSLLLFFLTGLFQGLVSSEVPDTPDHIYNLVKDTADVVAIGQLLAMPEFDGKTSKIKIAVQSVRFAASEQHIPTTGTALLRVPGPWPREYAPGSTLAIRATFQRPARYIVPGIFDYPAYLARENIWISGFIRSPAQLRPLTITSSFADKIRFFPEQLRARIGHFLDNNMPPQLAGLYRAILLGDRSHISYEIIESFKASGTMHILAISGLHMTLISTLLFTMIYWLLRRSEWLILNINLKKLAGILCLPLLVSYALLAGSNAPVLRATIMSAIAILAICTDRPKTLSALIAFAALLILVQSPQALFTASFQLSFAAFSSIMMCMPLFQNLLFPAHQKKDRNERKLALPLVRWATAALLASSAAVLGTAPMVVYHFHRFPLIGPLANLILEPLICLWALPLGFLALPCILLSPSLANVLLYIGGVGLDLATTTASLFQAIPYATLWLATPSLTLLVCYYASFLYAVINCPKAPGRTHLLIGILPFVLSLFLLLNPLLHRAKDQQDSAVVHFLDVGQGSSTLIQFSNGENMLIDGGGSAYSEESVGQRIIAPFLWSKGITQLDTIVLTHPDGDHYNGLPFLIEHFSPLSIWVSTLTGGSEYYRKMLQLAENTGVQVFRAESGQILRKGDTTVQCLANTDNTKAGNSSRNNGLIIQMTTGISQILFPGDIHSTTEESLIYERIPLKSDILLAAHHGSATSNSARFLQHVDPQVIVVSAGRSRRNTFPSEALNHYCETHQLPLLVTAKAGTIKISEKRDMTEISVLQDRYENPLRRKNEQWHPAQVIYRQGNGTGTATLQ